MARRRPVPRFAARFRELKTEREVSYRGLAARTFCSTSYLQELAAGKKTPSPKVARAIDDALGAGGELVALASAEQAAEAWPLADGWQRDDSERLAHVLTSETPTADNAFDGHVHVAHDPPGDGPGVDADKPGESSLLALRLAVDQRGHDVCPCFAVDLPLCHPHSIGDMCVRRRRHARP